MAEGRRHGIASAHFMCPSKPSDVAIGEFAWKTADGERRYQRRVCAAVEPRTSAVHRSQARHTAWVAGRVVPAAPSNADHEPNSAPTELAALQIHVTTSRHAAHGHLDNNHGAAADQVSAGHVDVDCPLVTVVTMSLLVPGAPESLRENVWPGRTALIVQWSRGAVPTWFTMT